MQTEDTIPYIEDFDTSDAWEWDVLTIEDGVSIWTQPGKPRPTEEQFAAWRAEPKLYKVSDLMPRTPGAQQGDVITVVNGVAQLRSWAAIDAGRRAAAEAR